MEAHKSSRVAEVAATVIMGSISTILLLSMGMFIGSMLSGLIPLWMARTGSRTTSTSTPFMSLIVQAIGAGLFMGTALSVIIPEGAHFLLSQGCPDGLPASFGVSLSLGFAFMLIIERISGGHDHSHDDHSPRLPLGGLKSNESKTHGGNSSAFIGLLVHSAADGIALGAVSLSDESSVEMIVFLALMIHKAPASFALMAHLAQQGRPRAVIIRNLIAFSVSAPLAAIATFVMFAGNAQELSQSRLGNLMLFSAGTFLFVATIHILPEVLHAIEGNAKPWYLLGAVVIGLLLPSAFDMSHNHAAPSSPQLSPDHNHIHTHT